MSTLSWQASLRDLGAGDVLTLQISAAACAPFQPYIKTLIKAITVRGLRLQVRLTK